MSEHDPEADELEQRVTELEDTIEEANDLLAGALGCANATRQGSTMIAGAFSKTEEAHHTLTEQDPTRTRGDDRGEES